MPGHPRKDIVREGEIGIYHTWSRCVQRAFLCGEDPLTGQNFEHRRNWIKSLLEYQASVFAVDIGNYSILSNHQHLMARTRPDIARTWSDEQVAWRWKLAWPTWIDGQWVREPTDQEIGELLANPEHITVLRGRLASLSWLMARWKEPIAKLANAESQTKGHFYEQRFGSRELVDDGANLGCNVYLDLNQLKARMAPSLETSTCSAIYDRLLAWRKQETLESLDKFLSSAPEGYILLAAEMEHLLADCFLAPIGDQGPLWLLDASGASQQRLPAKEIIVPTVDAPNCPSELTVREGEPTDQDASEPTPSQDEENSTDDESNIAGPASSKSSKSTRRIHKRLQPTRRKRASDNVILDIPRAQYIQIVRWTAEQLGANTAAQPPPELEAVLRTWGIQPSCWSTMIEHFEQWFHIAVGSVAQLTAMIERTGQKWIQGIRHCRDAFT